MSNIVEQTQTEVVKEESVITNKDLRTAALKWAFCYYHAGSYVNFFGTAFAWSIARILRKLYKDDEEFSKALSREQSIYITCAGFGAVINGVIVALEEEKSKGEEIPDDTFMNIKAALMGPMAGFGDTIVDATLRTLQIAIFQPMAAAGLIFAPIMAWIIQCLARPTAAFILLPLGYHMGRDAALDLLDSGLFKKLLGGAAIVSMFVMGALSCSYVNLVPTITWASGSISLYEIMESCVPGLLKLAPVLISYGLLRKKVNMVWIIIGILAVSILGALVGIW